jgi:uncharacterized phage protein gp47/JayE
VWFDIAINPNTVAVQEAVSQSLSSTFLREATVGGILRLSHIREAISVATGEFDNTINEIFVDNTPRGIGDIYFDRGHLPIFSATNMIFQQKV